MGKKFFLSFLTISLVLLSVVLDTLALKCWSCDISDVLCKDPFRKNTRNRFFQDKYLTECPEPLEKDYVSACKKVKLYDGIHKYRVRRTCATEKKTEIECVHRFGSELIYCGTCRTDGCNNNVKNAPIISLIAIASILVSFLFLFTL